MVQITEELKAKAEVYYGDEISRVKIRELLKEVGLPGGLLPAKDIVEIGYVEPTGFVWLKQKRRVDHLFEKIGRVVSFAPEVTATVEKFRIKNVKGVRTRELLVWFNVCEISVDDPPTGRLTCRTPSGLFRTFPTSAFELDVDGVGPTVDVAVEKEMASAAAEIDEGAEKVVTLARA